MSEQMFTKSEIAALKEAAKSVEYVKSVINSYRKGKEMIEAGKAMMADSVSELTDSVKSRLDSAAGRVRPIDGRTETAIAAALGSAALDAALITESDQSVEESIDKIEDWMSCVEQDVDSLIGL